MTQSIITQPQSDIIEQVIIKGDLSQLSPAERVNYYRAVCESIGLNPLTKPFDYISLKGKLTLYAKKDATDQLRKINGVSIGKPDITFKDDLIIVSVAAHNSQGREDSDIGVVRKGDMNGDVANALMKAVTKAKRRVTLSLCGLGWLDETEVETIPDAKRVDIVDDLGPDWTEQTAEHGTTESTTTPPSTQANTNRNEWPTAIFNKLVIHYKSGNIHEYRGRLSKSALLKPSDDIPIIIHWMDVYNAERGKDVEPDEAARRADADRQAALESK